MDPPPVNKGPAFGIRHVQVLLLILHIVALYYCRMNVSMSIVAMTEAAKTNPDFPEYDWTEKEKSYILSVFCWTYVFTQFPSSWMVRHIGVKTTLLIAEVGSGIVSALTPFAVRWGEWKAYCGMRLCMGLFQGLFMPCLYGHLANWSPTDERTRLGAVAHVGFDVAMMSSNLVAGFVASSPLGWPGISYVGAGFTAFVVLLWIVVGSNNPRHSRFIKEEERHYIESSLERNEEFHDKKIPIPWRAIFTSVPFYAHVIVRFCGVWGGTTIAMELPLYMNGVLDLNIKENAVFSSLPYICSFIGANLYWILADIIMKKKLMTLSVLRKSANSFSYTLNATVLIAIGFLEKEHKYIIIALLNLSALLGAGAVVGNALNILDLSPNHASMIMGIINPIMSLVGIIVPIFVGLIVKKNTNRGDWQIVFALTALFLLLGNLLYVIFGSTDVQPWNDPDYLENEKKKASEK